MVIYCLFCEPGKGEYVCRAATALLALNATEVYLRLAAPTVFQDEGYTNPLTLCEKAG